MKQRDIVLSVTGKDYDRARNDPKVMAMLNDYGDLKRELSEGKTVGELITARTRKNELASRLGERLEVPESVSSNEYVEALHRLSHSFLSRKLVEYEDSKAYVKEALREREKWKRQGDKYDPDQAPGAVRGACRVSLENVKNGVATELCASVENIPQSVGYDIARLLDVEPDTNIIAFSDALTKNLGVARQVALERRRELKGKSDGLSL